jgi:hypothetical protein
MTGNNIDNIGSSSYNIYGRNLSGYHDGNRYNQNNLAEIASEIQQIILQLEKTYPTHTTTEKMLVASEIVEQIENNQAFKERIINAIKAGSIEAFSQLLNHPVSSFLIGALEEWEKEKNVNEHLNEHIDRSSLIAPVVEELVDYWRIRLSDDYPEQNKSIFNTLNNLPIKFSIILCDLNCLANILFLSDINIKNFATNESIIKWLLGNDLNRFENLNTDELEIAKQAMEYRYRILCERYLEVGRDRGYRNLIARLGSLVTLRNKIQTWISLSRDRQRSVLDVLQEVVQELLQSDNYIQQQIAYISEVTDDSRLNNALLFASVEEYCLRPIRNQPLIVYRFVNYLRRTQRGGLTQVPNSDLLKLVSEDILIEEDNDRENFVNNQAIAEYQETQEINEQEVLRQLVKQEFEDYLQENLGEEAVIWFQLYLQGKSQDKIAKELGKPMKEIYRLREKVSYHAVRVFALKDKSELVDAWLGTSLQDHNLGLTSKQFEKFYGKLASTQKQILQLRRDGNTIEKVAEKLKLKTHQVMGEWTKLYLTAQALRTVDAIPTEEAVVSYKILFAPQFDVVIIGGDIEVAVYLNVTNSNNSKIYLLEIPYNTTIANELNIILKAPGFQLDGDNTASLPLDLETTQETQTATFRLTALRPGNATITAEFYRGDTFETKLETQIQVADIDEATFIPQPITTQPRPVPQADFILRIQTIEDETNSTYKFQYQLRSFRLPSVFSGNNIYTSSSFSISWVEQVRELLVTTLENISGSLPQEGKLRLISLGQYLFNHLFPTELQSDIRSLIPQNSTFTLLILTDQDISIPWELLHDGQRFFAARFIIGRWLQELSDTRPYEFPVGVVNIAHYANVEQPELWTTLLAAPGAPPPQLLPEGILHDSTEVMRGLHLIRYSQPADAANRRDAPVRLDNTNDVEEIETKIRPAKLNLRRNRPFVTLGYVKTDVPELAELEKTWASAFIRAGCSGFTGSLWAVEPSVEAAFISSFYNQLWTGASLGEAFYTSRQFARAVAPDSLDWLAYVLFGDPMARPYLPVEGKGYAVVEPIGRDIDEPMPVGVPLRFRLSLRRTPPVWHEDRVMEVAEDLRFENLQVHVNAFGLEVTPDSIIDMNLAPTGNYLGWFTLTAPPEIVGNSVLVEVYFMDGEQPIDNLIFSLEIANEGGEIDE